MDNSEAGLLPPLASPEALTTDLITPIYPETEEEDIEEPSFKLDRSNLRLNLCPVYPSHRHNYSFDSLHQSGRIYQGNGISFVRSRTGILNEQKIENCHHDIYIRSHYGYGSLPLRKSRRYIGYTLEKDEHNFLDNSVDYPHAQGSRNPFTKLWTKEDRDKKRSKDAQLQQKPKDELMTDWQYIPMNGNHNCFLPKYAFHKGHVETEMVSAASQTVQEHSKQHWWSKAFKRRSNYK